MANLLSISGLFNFGLTVSAQMMHPVQENYMGHSRTPENILKFCSKFYCKMKLIESLNIILQMKRLCARCLIRFLDFDHKDISSKNNLAQIKRMKQGYIITSLSQIGSPLNGCCPMKVVQNTRKHNGWWVSVRQYFLLFTNCHT